MGLPVTPPKLIHQIWVGSPVPDGFDAYRRSWARHHPGWDIHLWTDGNLPKLANQRLYDAAADYVPPENIGQFRADIARYELLWRFGGVYVDIDFEALKPIDRLLDGVDCFAAWEIQDRWIANGFMGCVPKHPFVGRLIGELPASVERLRGNRPNRSSGPQYLTRLYRQDPTQMTVFPTWLFYPYLYSDIGTVKAEPPWPTECVAVHHWWNRRRMLERQRADGR